MPTPSLGPTLSVLHASERLDCSDDHIRNLMSNGDLRYIDIGRYVDGKGRPKIRIPIADLDAFVESRTYRSTAPQRGARR